MGELDATWKSYLHSLPKGTVRFFINSSINTLLTKASLQLWDKQNNDKCKMCGWREILNHSLSSCKVSLNQARFTFRHNQVLKEMIKRLYAERYQIYSGIKG